MNAIRGINQANGEACRTRRFLVNPQRVLQRRHTPVTSAEVVLINGDPVQEWIDFLRAKGRLETTLRLYRRTVEIFIQENGDPYNQTPESVEAWLNRKGGSAGTYSNRLSALRSFYRWAVRTKKQDIDPTLNIEAPKQRKGVPKPVKDLPSVLVAFDEQDARVGRRIGETRDMAVFLAETGLRPVPCPPECNIIGKGHKEAIVLVTDKAREAWDRLGSWPIGARATQRRFEKAGVTPHMFRHWRATSLVRAGVEIGTVSKIMRHSSPAITMCYSEYATDTLRAALGKVVE